MTIVTGMDRACSKVLLLKNMFTYETRLKISGIEICLLTPQVLSISEEFTPFLKCHREEEVLEEGCSVHFFEADQLPVLPETFVYKGFGFKVYAQEDILVRYYYKPELGENAPFYACSIPQADGGMNVFYRKNCEISFNACRICFSHMAFEELLLNKGRMILHASCVSAPFGGLVFSGPSGIGKSTQANLWSKLEDSTVINGDRAILYRSERGWRVAGSPYAGSSEYYVNKEVPVTAIVMLEQAEECTIRLLHQGEAFRRIYTGLLINGWNPAYVTRLCNLCELLTAEVPVYLLACTPNAEAVETLKKVLEEGDG